MQNNFRISLENKDIGVSKDGVQSISPIADLPTAENNTGDVDMSLSDIVKMIEDHSNQVEFACADMATLENITDVIKKSGDAGLDPFAAEIANVAAESIYARLGVRPSKRHPKVALERFGSSDTRLNATKMALEGFKESVQRIWAAIVAAFKRMGEILKGFLGKMWAVFDNTKKKAQALMEITKKLPDAPKPGARFKASRRVGQLYSSDVSQRPINQIVIGMKNMVDNLQYVNAGVTALAAYITSDVHSYAEKFKASSEDEVVTIVPFQMNKFLRFNIAAATSTALKDVIQSPVMPGGRLFLLTEHIHPAVRDGQVFNGNGIKFEYEVTRLKVIDEDIVMPVAAVAQLNDILGSIIEACDAIGTGKPKVEHLTQAHKAFVSQIEALSKTADDHSGSNLASLKSFQDLSHRLNKMTLQILTVSQKLANTVCSECLEYVNSCIKNYDKVTTE